MSMFLSFLGFLLYFLYDINSVTKKNPVGQKGFFLGSCLVAAATLQLIINEWGRLFPVRPIMLSFLLPAVFFLFLLIYTLFFALPFQETYVEACEKRQAYTKGVYGLCRHPGVLWFAGFYICLAAAGGGAKLRIFALWVIGLNLCYVIFQDCWTFPRTFSNYTEYKKVTPFLFPNRKSIRVCIDTMTSGKGRF